MRILDFALDPEARGKEALCTQRQLCLIALVPVMLRNGEH